MGMPNMWWLIPSPSTWGVKPCHVQTDRQTDGLSGPVGTPTSRPGLARWTESAAPRLFGVGSVLEGKSPA